MKQLNAITAMQYIYDHGDNEKERFQKYHNKMFIQRTDGGLPRVSIEYDLVGYMVERFSYRDVDVDWWYKD